MYGTGDNSDRVAQCAVLAMLFELSSSPKPGNIDRCHDFSDIGFHHFLASAVSAYPVFKKAALGEGSAGSLILGGVQAWKGWRLKSNTHFGSLVLLIPIALAAGRKAGREARREAGREAGTEEGLAEEAKVRIETREDSVQLQDERRGGLEEGPKENLESETEELDEKNKEEMEEELKEELARILRSSTVQDAIDFYQAFDLAGARVADVDLFSLKDPELKDDLLLSNKTLLDLMRLSEDHDIVAREWATDYKRSFRMARRLQGLVLAHGLNGGVVRTFLEALAEVPDSLILAKFGREKAKDVSSQAARALLDQTLDKAREMDSDLLEEDINPGSTADLIAASLFISLLMGLRF